MCIKTRKVGHSVLQKYILFGQLFDDPDCALKKPPFINELSVRGVFSDLHRPIAHNPDAVVHNLDVSESGEFARSLSCLRILFSQLN
ncbi:MAG: hypothetical protein ACETWK_07110 [Candidatus Aminicenantaceae bacterium]